jgi:hypothetical protein
MEDKQFKKVKKKITQSKNKTRENSKGSRTGLYEV